jgi:hypothetical protein
MNVNALRLAYDRIIKVRTTPMRYTSELTVAGSEPWTLTETWKLSTITSLCPPASISRPCALVLFACSTPLISSRRRPGFPPLASAAHTTLSPAGDISVPQAGLSSETTASLSTFQGHCCTGTKGLIALFTLILTFVGTVATCLALKSHSMPA